MGTTDWCTGFPEYWYRWTGLFKTEKFYIGSLCKDHDENCSSHGFIKALVKERAVGGFIIWVVASLACWVKYPKLMAGKV